MRPDENKKRNIVICGKGGGSENVDWDDIQNKPSFATVATTGNYSDLNGTPTIPAAPVQSDWNEADNTSLAYIANKPTIPAAQVNADWNSNSGVSQILNKPVIPTVPAMATETITFTLQGGVRKTVDFYTVPNYFYVQDISGSDNTLTISQPEVDAPEFDVFSSTDRVNWTNIGNTGVGGITATIPANGKLYLKATTSGWSTIGVRTYNTITASGNHNIGGNIMSLLNGDNFENTTLSLLVTHNLQYLFQYDTTLVSAEELILPTNVVEECYAYMFEGCTSLTTAPVLPATTTAIGCYMDMFYDCSSLNKIVTYAEDEALDALMNWVYGVAAQGDFYNFGGNVYQSGDSGIPTGWTEHTS